MNNSWILYDPTKETKTETLSTEEAQYIILRLKTKAVENYLIKRDDWEQWKKLTIFLESPESPFMNTIPLGAPDEDPKVKPVLKDFSSVKLADVDIKDAFGKHAQQFDGDEFSADAAGQKTEVNISFKNLNKTTAFSPKRTIDDAYKIELLLIHQNGEMVRTVAQDISLTGTFCEKILPGSFHNCIFDVVIINNVINDQDYKRLTLKGKVVVTDTRIYIQYVNITDEQKNTLRAGLDYYLRAVKKLQKENA